MASFTELHSKFPKISTNIKKAKEGQVRKKMEDWQDYYDYLCRHNERSGGLPSDVSSRMAEYASDPSNLANDLVAGLAEVILLFPHSTSKGSDNSSLSLLHQCVINEQLTDVTGIPDLLRFTPPRAVAFGSLVRPLAIPKNREDDPVPTTAQLGRASLYEEFVNSRGDGRKLAKELATTPAFVRLHPSAAAHFLPLEGVIDAKAVFDEFLAVTGDFSEERREAALRGQGPLLLFLWAVGNGFTGTRPRIKQPDYAELAEVSERAGLRFQEMKRESAAGDEDGNGKGEGEGSTRNQERDGDHSGDKWQTPPPEEDDNHYEEGGGSYGRGSRHEKADGGKERRRRRHRSSSRFGRRTRKRRSSRRSRSRSRDRSRDRSSRSNRSRSQSMDRSRDRRSRRIRSPAGNRSRGRGRRSNRRSPSSSSSSSSSLDSWRGARLRHRRGRHSQDGRERNRLPDQSHQAASPIRPTTSNQSAGGSDLADLLTEMRGYLASTCDYQRASTLRLDQERKDRSTIGQYAARQKFLARFLAARSYRDENPAMSGALQDLLATKNPLAQWQMIQDMVNDARPPGIISRSGVTHFLSRGFLDEHQPGGFTLFMFSPFKKLTHRLSQRKKDIKLAYGEIGKLSEDDIDGLAKNGYHLPTSMSDAKDMLKVGVWFLEELTYPGGIASEGYREGLRLIENYGDRFREAAEKDSGFPAKFLGYLDSLFQHFCSELKDLAHRSSPIYQARKRLRGFMIDEVNDTFKKFKIYGIVPQLNHPLLDDYDEEETKTVPEDKDKTRTKTDQAPEWHSKNPTPEKAWSTPTGKQHNDFFNSSSQLGKDNVARLPSCKHHRTGKTQTICAKYQASGMCCAGCGQSHIRPADMSSELKQKTGEAFAKAYKKS